MDPLRTQSGTRDRRGPDPSRGKGHVYSIIEVPGARSTSETNNAVEKNDDLSVRHLVKALLVGSEKGPKKCLEFELFSPSISNSQLA